MQQGIGLRGLSRMEVREFGELYRRAASDLAIVRAETRDAKLINYLNSLVIRAHGKIYRAESEGVGLIWKFFAEDFPRAFRANFRFIFAAFAVFTLFGVLSFTLCLYSADFGTTLGLDSLRVAAETNSPWWTGLNDANQIGASNILTHNIQISLYAFALGALLCVGAFYILMMNGILIGGTLGVCFKANPAFGGDLITFMVGHGVIELTCVFIAAGAGLMIGYAVINPGDLTRAHALKQKGTEAARLAIGCSCFLVIAGIIEGFLSPSDLPPAVKFATGIGTGLAMYAYLALAGRKDHGPQPGPVAPLAND